MKKNLILTLIFLSILTTSSFAETTMSEEGQYIFNSLAFYIGGVLVAFMAAGFCMLESGLVTTRSVSTIAAKNIASPTSTAKSITIPVILLSTATFCISMMQHDS